MPDETFRAAETELRERSEGLRLALMATGVGTWEIDLVNDRRIWSEQTCRLHGLERTGAGDQEVSWDDRLMHPEDRRRLPHLHDELRAGRNTYEFEYRTQRQGEERWIEARGTVFKRDSRGPTRIVGISSDITERKKADECKRESEERLSRLAAHLFQAEQHLRLATDAGEMFGWELDLETNQQTFAPNAAALIGCDPQLLTSDPRDAEFFVAPHDRQRVRDAFVAAMAANEDTCSVDFEGLEPAPERKYWRTLASFIRDAKGNVARIAGITQNITLQKSSEIALRTLAERLSTTEEAAAVLIYDWDRLAGAVWRSAGLTAILGWSQDDIAPTPEAWASLVHAEDLQRFPLLRCDDYVGPNDRYRIEYRVRHKAGHYIWVMDSGQVFRNPNGEVMRAAGVTVDISARKQDERSLRRQASLIDLSFEPIFVWHPQRGIVDWNKGAEQVYGYTREEALGRYSHNLLQTSHSLPLSEILAVLKNQRNWTGEVRHRTKDGRTLIVESRHQLVESEGDLFVLETNRDITESRRAAADVARLAAVALASHDALYGASLAGVIEAWDPSAERLFGYTAEEAVGRQMSLIVEPELQPEQNEFLARAASGETVGPFDTRRRRKDGNIVNVSVAMAPVKASDGSVVAISVVSHDIGERLEWEARQRLMTRELTHRVKNSFAVLLAILRSTLSSAASPEQFATDFAGRLHSLSVAQDILTESDWRGTEFGALARHLLGLYLPADSTRVSYAGPPVALGPEYAAPFALFLNELVTNALKYGSLSRPSGKIDLAWRLEWGAHDRQKLVLTWRESGGPPVAPTERRGFGSKLIENSIPGASVHRAFHAGGIVCTLELALPEPSAPGAISEP